MDNKLKDLYENLGINRKNDFRVNLVYTIFNPLLFSSGFYNLNVIGKENINNVKSPLLYLSRHHDERDILCQQKATKEIRNKYPAYLVKKSLDWMNSLELGVFPFYRERDIKNELNIGDKTREELEKYNYQLYFDLIPAHLASGEDFLIYPEGTRREGKPFKVKKSVLEDIIKINNITVENFDVNPIIIPVDYLYSENDIKMKFGNPLILGKEKDGQFERLKNHLNKNINY